MIFCALSLQGQVAFYDFTDKQLLTKTTLEAVGSGQAVPLTVQAAIAFWQNEVFQLEAFEGLPLAASWADTYTGFRAAEVRASFERFLIRKSRAATPAFNAA